jgi:hypothetical protein
MKASFVDTGPSPEHAGVFGLALGSRDGPCINSGHEPTSPCSPLWGARLVGRNVSRPTRSGTSFATEGYPDCFTTWIARQYIVQKGGPTGRETHTDRWRPSR